MATVKQVVGSRTSLTTSALNSLASATFVSAGTITHNTNQPLDVLVEVTATPGTVSGNKQLVVYAKASLDGSNQTTGPETGTAVTDEPNLYYVGTLPLNTNSTTQTRCFRSRRLTAGCCRMPARSSCATIPVRRSTPPVAACITPRSVRRWRKWRR